MLASGTEKRHPWYSLQPARPLTDKVLMKILALETSGTGCSAALLIDSHLEQRQREAPRQHADLILGMLDALLREAELSLPELDAIAYGRGPGSFTGVRIAAAVAQGIAYGAGRPVIAVSTLAATARAAFNRTGCRRIACAFDARMDEVYWGCFEIDAQERPIAVGDELVIEPASTAVLQGLGWCGAGSGWAVYPELQQRHRSALASAGDGDGDGDAGRVNLIAEIGAAAGDIAWLAGSMADAAKPADRALPVYLRHQVTDASRRPPRA